MKSRRHTFSALPVFAFVGKCLLGIWSVSAILFMCGPTGCNPPSKPPAIPAPVEINSMDSCELFSGENLDLVRAAERGDLERINQLVKKGVAVNQKGRYDVTPLLRCMLAKNKEGFHALLKHGASPNTLDVVGSAVMFEAAVDEDPTWLGESLKYGGDANLINTGNPFAPGQTPLFYAIGEKRTENVRILLKSRADVDHKSKSDLPLVMAAGRQCYDIVYLLLESGADFQKRQGEGGYNLVEWVNTQASLLTPEEQKPWLRRTIEFLKAKGAEIDDRRLTKILESKGK